MSRGRAASQAGDGREPLINRRYLLGERLGGGAEGRIYRARDRWFDDRPVALKMLDPGRVDAAALEGLRVEFSALARLSHPHLVEVYELGIVAGSGAPFLTMELLPGRALSDLPLPLGREDLLALLVQVCQALDYIHARGILHHDLKPGNVLLAQDGEKTPLRLKLADFGMAAGAGPTEGGTGGTPGYMAPERLAGAPGDRRADLYSLGALLFHAATGHPPFHDQGPERAWRSARAAPPPLAQETRDLLGPGLCDVITQLLDPSPGRRFPGAAAVVEAVKRTTGLELELDTPAARYSLAHGAPLVGRSAAVEELQAELDGLARGETATRARLVLIEGEAGVGKTRLLREAVIQAQMSGLQVLEGDFLVSRAHPLGPWPAILERLEEHAATRLRSAELEGLRRHLAPLRAALARQETVRPERLAKERLLAGVTRFLAAAGAPTVLALEELGAAQGTAREILGRLVRARDVTSILVLTTSREPQALRAPPERVRRLTLERLDLDGVKALVGSMLGIAEPPGALVELLHRGTGGNPLLLEEAVHGLIEDGHLVRGPEGWRLPGGARSLPDVPSGAGELLRGRLAHLGAEDRRTLQALALAGGATRASELAAVLDEPAGEDAAPRLEARLRRLVSRGLLEERPTPAGSGFEVPHAMMRRILVESCDEDVRRELHRRFGEAMASRGGASLRDLARHFAGAGDGSRAAAYARDAAREARGAHAYELAAELYLEALRHTPAGPSGIRSELHEEAAQVEEAVGASRRALQAYEAALAECPAPVPPGREAALVERMAWNAVQAGDLPAAGAHARRSLELCRAAVDAAGEARARKTLGIVLSRDGDFEAAHRCYTQALAILEELDDQDAVAGLLNNLGLLASFQGDAEGAASFLGRSLSLRRSMGDRAGQIGPLLNLGFVRARGADHEGALRTLDEAVELAAEVGDLQNLGNAHMHRAESLRSLGALDDALAAWERALHVHQETDDRARQLHCYDRIGDLHRSLIDPALAAEHHRRALDLAAELQDTVQEAYALASLGLDQLGLGEPQATANLERALDAGVHTGKARVEARALRGLALADAMRGDWPGMEVRARRLMEVAVGPGLEEDAAWGLRLLGEALLGRGDPGEGRRSLLDAIASARESTQPEIEREAELLVAVSLETEGRLGEALERRLRAQEILEERSMKIRDEKLRSEYQARARRPASTARPEAPPAPARSARGLGGLYEISQAMNSILDPEELLEKVVDLAIEKLGADRGAIILFDGPGGEMRVRVARNTERETLDDALAYSRNVVREAADGQPVLSVDVGEDSRFRDFRSVRMYGIRSLLCVPLRLGGTIVGTVYLDSRQPAVAFADEDLRFLEIFANMAALALHNARSHEGLRKENLRLREEIEGRFSYGNIIGKSARIQDVFRIMEKVTESALPVLILGESGTGKELVARSIHFNGPRKSARFCSQNCAALPETLLESELFGHLKGSFTGADASRQGLFELADGGTLFLDEIGDMSLPMQGKVLRAIQDGEIRPVGGRKSIHVDVRFLSATNRNLEQMVKKGEFREDLYYRLNVVRVTLPPLRDRKEDIPLLVDHFLAKAAEAAGKPPKRLDEEALALLLRYHWPGNIRELENEVQKLSVFSEGEVVRLDDLNRHRELFDKLTDLSDDSPLESIEEVERKQIVRALLETAGHRGKAAKLLGISRATIFRKIKQFGISV